MRGPGQLAAVLLSGAALAGTAGRAAAAPAHYVVFEVDPDGVAQPKFARVVDLDREPVSKTDLEVERLEAAAARAGDRAAVVSLTAPDGSIVYRDVVALPTWIRGEFHGRPDGDGGFAIDAHRIRAEQVAFVVRVPLVHGSSLALDGAARGAFDPAQLVAATERGVPEAVLATRSVGRGDGGPSGNRVDLLIMGDGYTAAQQGLFEVNAQNIVNGFFAIRPYVDYRSFYRVTPLFTPSNQAGADHPPYDPVCPGTPSCCSTAANDPLAGTFVDTAFDARYCVSNTFRLIGVNGTDVLAAASAEPDWDTILVIVNDFTYGGSGGFLSVTSVHASAVDIARHEYGHSFTGLADEYEDAFSYPPCSDVTGSPCEANVTDEQVPGLIKWAPWIEPTTPIPTPETSPYANVVGLFEGARYDPIGMFRPRLSACLMRELARPFCQVCCQEYVLMLYRGGWGVPAGGIDPIEPGSENPPPGPVVASGPLTLSVDLVELEGAHGSTLEVQWSVEGVPQPTPSPPGTFEFVPSGPGSWDVRVEVRDTTAYVHPEMAGSDLTSERAWTVSVAGAASPGDTSSLTVGRALGSAGDLVLEWTESCSAAVTDYGIYEGDLGVWYSHARKDCEDDDGLPLSETISPQAGSSYYLVVPHHAAAEGSYGSRSSGLERPVGSTTCALGHDPGCP